MKKLENLITPALTEEQKEIMNITFGSYRVFQEVENTRYLLTSTGLMFFIYEDDYKITMKIVNDDSSAMKIEKPRTEGMDEKALNYYNNYFNNCISKFYKLIS